MSDDRVVPSDRESWLYAEARRLRADAKACDEQAKMLDNFVPYPPEVKDPKQMLRDRSKALRAGSKEMLQEAFAMTKARRPEMFAPARSAMKIT